MKDVEKLELCFHLVRDLRHHDAEQSFNREDGPDDDGRKSELDEIFLTVEHDDDHHRTCQDEQHDRTVDDPVVFPDPHPELELMHPLVIPAPADILRLLAFRFLHEQQRNHGQHVGDDRRAVHPFPADFGHEAAEEFCQTQ